jgi:hypothetical protein
MDAAGGGVNSLLDSRNVFGNGHRQGPKTKDQRYTKASDRRNKEGAGRIRGRRAERTGAKGRRRAARAGASADHIMAVGGAGSLGSPAAVSGRKIIKAASKIITTAPIP